MFHVTSTIKNTNGKCVFKQVYDNPHYLKIISSAIRKSLERTLPAICTKKKNITYIDYLDTIHMINTVEINLWKTGLICQARSGLIFVVVFAVYLVYLF